MSNKVRIHEHVKTSLETLQKAYQSLPWYKKLFFPGAISSALAQYKSNPTSESVFAVCHALEYETWGFQKYFFNALQQFSKTILFGCFENLGNRGLLSGKDRLANFEATLEHPKPKYFPEMFQLMRQVGLLSGEHAQHNRDAISKEETYPGFPDQFKMLIKSEFLLLGDNENTQANFNRVFIKNNSFRRCMIDIAITKLYHAGILLKEDAPIYFDAITDSKEPAKLGSALKILYPTGLLKGKEGPSNLKALEHFVAQDTDGHNTIKILSKTGLFSDVKAQSNFKILMNKESDYYFLFNNMKEQGLLTKEHAQANFDAVMNHHSISSLSLLLKNSLFKDKMSQDLFSTLIAHPYPKALYLFLHFAAHHSSIEKDKLSFYVGEIIKHPLIFFGNKEVDDFWIKCSYKNLTISDFDKIIQISKDYGTKPEEGQIAFKAFAASCPKRPEKTDTFFSKNPENDVRSSNDDPSLGKSDRNTL